ncbi:uncharacterized protein LOC123307094 [Coccinella septempunctata]|uniref:uncharacterized protein LOC123307094 n=1 Tax=Coccinella septempunctata TaxID=41139 RepID=UPI001D07E385|nr:uncharacterized protein LOC123307094 [Coccinella septempunctata]
MSTIFLILSIISFFVGSFSEDSIETVDLLQIETYKWEGLNSGSAIINVTAQNHSISVNIETCDIGNPESRPNKEYLILKNGNENPLSQDNGRIFAYIKKPKTIYFFSSSVILQLETPNALTKKCTVTFEKGDDEDPPLPPVTTTESVSTYGPEVSKYSTVFISGCSIEQFNEDKKLIKELKDDIVAMAEDYTETEGFCLTKKIEPEDVNIYTLEQCPTQWQDFANCVRLVYSLPLKTDSSCSLWKGYQLAEEHLNIMWTRLASKYLKGFSVYEQPEINSLLTWWVICIILVILLFAAAIISVNLIWRRNKFLKRANTFDDGNYTADMRKISEMSLTPPYFQPIPPMFGKTDLFVEVNGADNEGFQYDAIDENGTAI